MRTVRWMASNRRLPVFADNDLVVASAVHGPKCVAVAQPDGIASMQWCRCHSARQHIDSGTPQPVEGFVQSAGSRGVQSVGSFAFLAVFDLSGFQAQGFTPHEEERRQ